MSRKPTVIGQKPVGVAPTAMPGTTVEHSPQKVDSATPLKPTAVVSKPETSVVTSQSVRNVRASTIPGVARPPLKVERLDLENRYGGYDYETITELVNVLQAVAPAVFDVVAISKFGASAQQKYSESVSELLEVVNINELRQAPRHIERLQDLLNEVAEALADNGWFKRASPLEKFQQVHAEVVQLKLLLETCDDALTSARKKLRALAEKAVASHTTTTAYMLGCDYLSSLLPQSSDVLLERSLSLGKTVSLLKDQILQAQHTDEQVRLLSSRIQEGVSVSLPAWIAAVTTATQNELNETQKFVLRDQLMEVIRRLT